jgi:glycosyltransferase involved in cell wall biosynthesis
VRRIYGEFPEQMLISISQDQATWLTGANWIANVYNSIDVTKFHFRSEHGDYLMFLGRISPEKRPDRAIELAREVGMNLVIAAKVDPKDQAYFENAIRPLIDASPLVEFVGEVDDEFKDQLLGGAYAYLFPIDWPEPFGLTMIESLAAGTPVISTRNGAVPEVIMDGVTGFVCDSFKEMIEAISKIRQLDRANCRAHVELNFSTATMASRYESVYQSVVKAAVESMHPVGQTHLPRGGPFYEGA